MKLLVMNTTQCWFANEHYIFIAKCLLVDRKEIKYSYCACDERENSVKC